MYETLRKTLATELQTGAFYVGECLAEIDSMT